MPASRAAVPLAVRESDLDGDLVARALGDPLRWRIVLLLAGERLCVGHLAEQLGAAQPLVSHHLKALRAAGLSPAAHPRPSMPPAPSARGGTVMAHRQLDPISRQAFAAAIGELAEEFRGIFSLETVERYVDESIDRMSGARVVEFIPLFVHRFARDRLRALGQVEGAIVKDVPEVLFVCVHNAGRSQMAAALLDHHARGMVHVRSAGSDPADQLNPAVVAAMAEWEIDLSKEFPKPLTDEVVQAADAVITMGCGDACPIYPGKRYLDWELDDPAGKPVEQVRAIRDDIDQRVQALLAELVGDRPTGRQPA